MNRDTRVGRIRVEVVGAEISFWVHAPKSQDDGLFNRFLWHYSSVGVVWWVAAGGLQIFVAAVPSERLLALLHGFHETCAVMPLVDCLIEEYPELEPYLAGVTCEQ